MKLKVKNARASYPALFVAEPYDESKPTENRTFKIDLQISKSDTEMLKEINNAIIAGMKEEFGDKAPAMMKKFKADEKNYPLKDGDETLNKSGEPIAPGCFVLRAKRKENDGAPGVFDNKAGADGKPAKLTSESGRIYGGCYVNASVDIWIQNNKYQGVRCALLGVQFAKDGEAFGGSRPASADEFDALATEADMAAASTDDFADI